MAESSGEAGTPLRHALDLASYVLAEPPAGLLTDFDGTLSPIVADPAAARLADGAGEALEALTRRLAVVAVVTGRAPLDARRMAGVPGLLIAGNHGTEWLEPDADAPSASPDATDARDQLGAMLARVPSLRGVQVEDKGISATIHYRSSPDPDAARAAILDALGPPGAGLELRPGRMSVELRPLGLGDKGSATRAIVTRHALRGVVVMGDDLTDLDMFEAVADERRAGRLRGAIIGVGGADADVAPEVVAAADVVLEGVAEVTTLLVRLAEGPYS